MSCFLGLLSQLCPHCREQGKKCCVLVIVELYEEEIFGSEDNIHALKSALSLD